MRRVVRTVARRVRHGEGDDETIDELIEQLVIEERGDSELDVLNSLPMEDRKNRDIHTTVLFCSSTISCTKRNVDHIKTCVCLFALI